MRWLATLALAIMLAAGHGGAQTQEDLGTINQQAIDAYARGDVALARERAERAITVARGQPSPAPEDVGLALNNMAFLLMEDGDAAAAEELWRETVALIDSRGTEGSPVHLTALLSLASRMAATEGTEVADDLAGRAMRLARATPYHGNVAAQLFRHHFDGGSYDRAVVALNEAIAAAPDLLKDSQVGLYDEFSAIYDLSVQNGAWVDAAAVVEGMIALRRAYFPFSEEERDQSIRNLMHSRFFALKEAGEYDRAQDQLLVWQNTGRLSDGERAYVANMVEIVTALADGGNIDTLDRLGEVRTALLFARASQSLDDVRLALAMRTLATAEGYFGQNDRASQTLSDAIGILERSEHGRRYLHIFLDEMAWNLHVNGAPEQAAVLFERSASAEAAAPAFGPDPELPPDRAWRMVNRARFFADIGRYEEAARWIDSAETILATQQADSNQAFLWALARTRLRNLSASIAIDTGVDVDLAALVSSIDALRDIAPETSPDYTMALANAADLALVSGEFATARELLIEAVALNEAALPVIAPQAADTLAKLGQLEMVSGDRQAAITRFRKVVEARQSPVYRHLLPEASFDFEAFAWLLIDRPERTPHDLADAFEALQWTQITRSAEAVSFLETRLAAEDPTRGDLLRQRQDLLEQYTRAAGRLAAADRAGASALEDAAPLGAEIERVAVEIARVDTSLDALGLDSLGLGGVRPLSLGDVQAMLRPGELLVTFLLPSLNPDWIAGLNGSSNFAIGVSRDEVHVARMGEISRGTLRERIQAFRCQVAANEPGCEGGAQAALRGAMSVGGPASARPDFDFATPHALYVDLFGDLAEVLPDYRHVIIAPPPDLLGVPYQALITSPEMPGSFAEAAWMIRDHAISTLPSISSLGVVRQDDRQPKALTRMLGVGDPVIGTEARIDCGTETLAALRAAPADARLHLDPSDRIPPLADVDFLRSLPRLPDTVCELEAIRDTFDPAQSMVILGEAATETRVKELDASGALKEFDVLVFATHGLTAGETAAASPGLVMTPPASGSDADDGLLSAAEIATLTLDAELVVLSACNTAAGDDGDNDGLSGLARAFFLAGTRTLLVTQWSVYSEAAVELSSGLFTDMRQDRALTHSEALRGIVLSILDDPNRPALHHHPSYWAAFQVVGATPGDA